VEQIVLQAASRSLSPTPTDWQDAIDRCHALERFLAAHSHLHLELPISVWGYLSVWMSRLALHAPQEQADATTSLLARLTTLALNSMLTSLHPKGGDETPPLVGDVYSVTVEAVLHVIARLTTQADDESAKDALYAGVLTLLERLVAQRQLSSETLWPETMKRLALQARADGQADIATLIRDSRTCLFF
jgi:hypothetical protein